MVKIFIGNLSENSRSSDLRLKFEEHGTVDECDILNRYGFVHMASEDDAETAIKELNECMFDGHKIAVELSTGKSRGGRGGGVGRGGGGRGGGGRGGGGRGGGLGGRGRNDRGRDDMRSSRGRGDRFDPYGRAERMPIRHPYDDYPPHPYDRERLLRHDPYDRDPYSRDLYDRLPSHRDPYARDPYERPIYERAPPRDLYLERSLPPPREFDRIPPRGDPYAERGVRGDPYERMPAREVRDPYGRSDPYLRPPPEYYGQDRPRSPNGYDDRVPLRRPGGYDDPVKSGGIVRGIVVGPSMNSDPVSNGIDRGAPSRIGRF